MILLAKSATVWGNDHVQTVPRIAVRKRKCACPALPAGPGTRRSGEKLRDDTVMDSRLQIAADKIK